MKNLIFTIFGVLIFCGLFAQEIPQKISYQGKLLENGVEVNGTKSITFTIDTWSETKNVQVTDGLYSVTLGETTAIPTSIFDNTSSVNLQISVAGTNLTPQTEILSVPYAYKAEKAVDAEKIAGRTVSTTTPGTNQVLKWDGSSWAPGSDESGESYTAGTGISISGSTISAQSTTALWNANKLQGYSLSSSTPSSGQVLKWDGSNWAPGSDESGGSYTAGTGISISGSTISAQSTTALWNANKLQGYSLSSSTPSSGQVLKWNGSNWAPGTDEGGGSGVWTQSGSNIYYNSGNVGIGPSVNSPQFPLHIVDSETSLRQGIAHLKNTATNVDAAGVYGQCQNTDYYGYGGVFEGGYAGVSGRVSTEGNNSYCGVIGYAENSTLTATLYGVYGKTNGGNASSYGVYAFGNLGANGTKSFVIDHPLDPKNKYLKHFSIESPEVLNVYRGTVTLDTQGEAIITLPEYFKEINKNFSYHLTPIGNQSFVYVKEEIIDNQFKIAGGEPSMKVSWIVFSERNDLYIQKNPNSKKIEIEKSIHEKGKYTMPDLYGAPKEMGVFHKMDIKKK